MSVSSSVMNDVLALYSSRVR